MSQRPTGELNMVPSVCVVDTAYIKRLKRREKELLRLLREWSGTGIADCHCWNTDLRKRTNAALEVK
jgi:predicted nucleic acid-binding Zn ribbon protein